MARRRSPPSRATSGEASRAASGVFSRLALAATAVFGLLTGGCASLPPEVPRTGAFDAKRLSGGWHVLATNFPMWLTGEKTEPVFLYRLTSAPGETATLDDTVAYNESGRRGTIEGTDTQDPNMPTHFTWRGNGLLALFTSDWAIVATGPDDRWMVLYFTKTIATPEGVDVIARSPSLSPEDRAAVERLLARDPFLLEKSRGIVWLDETGKGKPASQAAAVR